MAKDVFSVARGQDDQIRTDYDRLLELVRESGMDYKWSAMFVKKLADDEKQYYADDATKEWALKRGFYPGRVELYGLYGLRFRLDLLDGTGLGFVSTGNGEDAELVRRIGRNIVDRRRRRGRLAGERP